MKLLIEEYQYDVFDGFDVLDGLCSLQDVHQKVSVNYVGYYYNPKIRDVVFILPKVLVDEKGHVFGRYTPESIIDLDIAELEDNERKFLYEFAVWIYRAIIVFNESKKDNNIVLYRRLECAGNGSKKKRSNTLLDIILSLLRFNKENRQFFTFILRNLHSGYNKINWGKTISGTTAIVQDDTPTYLRPINKKREVNFDEELLVIFFSILNFISGTYGFKTDIGFGFKLITGGGFKRYLDGYGRTRLRQIKYKYFSDTAVKLWNLCYAFFDKTYQMRINASQNEYLLVKSFPVVFEAMIDELVGDYPLPDGMNKKQEDGKIVDHLFTARDLIDSEANQTYYIGDSKYYKMGHELGSESIYKQYTYARNVIQWNLDIFNDGRTPDSGVRLRDDVTEGYNIIPNFFISAKLDESFDYGNDGIEKTDRRHNRHRKEQFKNRLFDRDTLLLFHYDVNFLFVLSLYARNNTLLKQEWKQKIRTKFRQEIQTWLQDDFDFYAMTAKPGIDAKQYFKTHFQTVLGKTYTPFSDDSIFSLALDKQDAEENKALITGLQKFFIIEPCKLGTPPEPIIKTARETASAMAPAPGKDGILMVMMEQYDIKRKFFLPTGKIAIGIKYTKDSMEIVEHLATIGYVLFHHRNNDEQHLFAVKGSCHVISASDIETDRYKNVGTTEMFISVDLDTSVEIDASHLNSAKKDWDIQTRYDAQYTTVANLK